VSRQSVVIALLLVGLGGLAWWIARNTYWDETSIPAPLTGEAADNPFYTAQKFAESLGATTEWRQSLGTLPDKNSILVLTYWHWSLIDSRRKQLESWVQNGGRLVLDHTLIGDEEQLEKWSGLAFADIDDKSDNANIDDSQSDGPSSNDKDSDQGPSQENQNPYYDDNVCGVLRTEAGTAISTRDHYSVCQLVPNSEITSTRAVTWSLRDDDGMQAARVAIGQGSVTLLNANPFGNRDLLEIDHGLLFVAITQLKHGDHVVFLSEEEHPSLLSLIWDYGKPVVLLCALLIAFALWRGAIRFGPPTAPTPIARRSLAEQIRGTGLFTLQFGGNQTLHATMIRALDEAARRRIVNYASLPSDKRIAALALATGLSADSLATVINHRGERSKHELQNAIALLETARRQLLARPQT
jgi:hypothetical protein